MRERGVDDDGDLGIRVVTPELGDGFFQLFQARHGTALGGDVGPVDDDVLYGHAPVVKHHQPLSARHHGLRVAGSNIAASRNRAGSALACGCEDRCTGTGCADNRDGRRSGSGERRRGRWCAEWSRATTCAACAAASRSSSPPRTHPRQVIANIYLEGAWNRVDHFHEECYLDAGEPYGPIDNLGGPFTA